MRLFRCVVVSAVALLCSVGLVASKDVTSDFVSWMQTHDKSYETDHELLQRFQIYRSNMDLIEEHNSHYENGMFSFNLKANQFADLTNEEYRSQYLGLKVRSTDRAAVETFEFDPEVKIPASLDWRTKNVVTPVKDQGQCGSCWAFSAVGAMEGAHALATGELKSLSEQELVDCVNGGADTCTAGGEMHDGFVYAIGAGGMESESDYPYAGTSNNTCAFAKSKSVATFTSYKNITSGDEAAFAQALVTIPTISVGIDASSPLFQFYFTGVFDITGCKNDEADLDHGVLVVGYGTDAASGKDYWIVKNSWAAIWGQQGYIWMVRNKGNECGVATDASYPVV